MERIRAFSGNLWNGQRVNLLVVSIYGLVTVLFTFPTAFKLRSVTFGETLGGDHLLFAWWRKYSWLNGLDYHFLSLSQAPFGTDHVLADTLLGLYTVLGLLSIPLGEVVAYNILGLGSYMLSAIFAYLLASQITQSRKASFAAGLVFAFSAYVAVNSQDSIELGFQWVLPMFVLALVNLHRRQTLLAAVLLGLAFAVTGYMLYYHTYHVAIAALTFAAVDAFVRYRAEGWKAAISPRRISLYALAVLVGVVLLLPEFLPLVRTLRAGADSPLRSVDSFVRDPRWFFYMSSRPWSFFLPPEIHPLFGGLSRSANTWIASLGGDFYPPFLEHSYNLAPRWFTSTPVHPVADDLYLGFINLGIAGYALWQARKGRLQQSPQEVGRRSFWVPYFAVLFVVAIAFTAPPYFPIGGFLYGLGEPFRDILIPTPALFSITFVTPLRASERFVSLAILALAVLVAVGLDNILASIKSGKGRYALMAAFVGLLAIEYAHVPNTTPVEQPPEEILWLADQQRGEIVAIYPLGPQRVSQRIHELPVIDSFGYDGNQVFDNLYLTEKMAVGSLLQPDAVPKLAGLGVRYVVNADDPLDTPQEGLTLLFTTSTAQVFEVTASPAPLVVTHTLRDGLWTSDSSWEWQGESFTMYVWNPLGEVAGLDVELVRQGEPLDNELLAIRQLTPHPERILVSGKMIDNPSIPPEYPIDPITAEVTPGGLIFESLLIEPGETALVLRWASEGPFPSITDLRFHLSSPPAHVLDGAS
jgi:hypothetical protein